MAVLISALIPGQRRRDRSHAQSGSSRRTVRAQGLFVMSVQSRSPTQQETSIVPGIGGTLGSCWRAGGPSAPNCQHRARHRRNCRESLGRLLVQRIRNKSGLGRHQRHRRPPRRSRPPRRLSDAPRKSGVAAFRTTTPLHNLLFIRAIVLVRTTKGASRRSPRKTTSGGRSGSCAARSA